MPDYPDENTDPLRRAAPRSVEFLLDVPLQVTVELGRTKMRIADLLRLAKGSVVELDKLAGEPLDLHPQNGASGTARNDRPTS